MKQFSNVTARLEKSEMSLSSSCLNPKLIRGWIFDVYPSTLGKMSVWIIGEKGERFRFNDVLRAAL